MSADDRFWAATARHESRFTGTADVREFRRAMVRLGHEPAVIRERVEAIHPDLLGDFDAIKGKVRYRCAICNARVRSMGRVNSEKAAITPARHKTPAGERCNGWLTEAIEEPA